MRPPNEIADITKIKYPCFVQPKLDGYRGIFVPEKLTFVSRENKEFRNWRKINEYFYKVVETEGNILDGELYIHGLKPKDLASILNKEGASIPDTLRYVIYDAIPQPAWDLQYYDRPYEDRLKDLRGIVNDQIADYSKVLDIATDTVHYPKELTELYREYLLAGYEGVIIRDIDGLYQWKRTTVKNGAILRLKPFKTIDLKVTEIYEAKGGMAGKAGGIVVDYNGHAVGVGSGFDLPTREEMWNNKENYIGKIAEIKYLEVTEAGSLRDPRFVTFREDKTNAEN